ncbi:MAG TPA: HEAT repeat domain-containing protein [Luteimicrobium sp.]|nr:HEAT repeat domain-containing protein [Luteimicrobium sp.]
MTAVEPPAPDEGPILASLGEIGYFVGSLAELRHSGVRYRKAIPTLVAALLEVSETKTLMEVVRVLSVPWARPAATLPLIELFRSVEDDTGLGLRWAVGNALDVTWSDDHFDELVELARDGAFGRSREMVVLSLGRSKKPEVGGVLIELLDDPIVSGHAIKALRKLKVPEARPGLERMLDDDRAWVRKEAQRALAALD